VTFKFPDPLVTILKMTQPATSLMTMELGLTYMDTGVPLSVGPHADPKQAHHDFFSALLQQGAQVIVLKLGGWSDGTKVYPVVHAGRPEWVWHDTTRGVVTTNSVCVYESLVEEKNNEPAQDPNATRFLHYPTSWMKVIRLSSSDLPTQDMAQSDTIWLRDNV
jgi:hypothetical protein